MQFVGIVPEKTIRSENGEHFECSVITSDDRTLITCTGRYSGVSLHVSKIQFWDVESGELNHEFEKHRNNTSKRFLFSAFAAEAPPLR